MMTPTEGKWRKLALALAVVAGALALSAALVAYLRFGRIDIGKIAAGIFFPALIYAVTSQNVSRPKP